MLTAQQQTSKQQAGKIARREYATDKWALAFLALAMSYLLLGLIFGLLGSLQYLLPELLRQQLAFQKTRPLHVYLAVSWIFTAAQGSIYYVLPRIIKKELYWRHGIKIHFWLQVITSSGVVIAFFLGYFGGREYLEFPPLFGALIAVSWLPFAVTFFKSLKPNFSRAPVYHFSWSIGIIFFFLTLSESYLWLFDYFNHHQVRDTTVQWKALGSMVGSWNMLVYGLSMYLMETLSDNKKLNYSSLAFFFFFLGFTNLLFNWGHHTYIVPAAPWVKTVAYVISMTELLIFGHLLWKFRRNMVQARRDFHSIPLRLLAFADLWIFLNLGAAIAISVPAINYYTHGTHITVAHAMGTTIGINTMLLFAIVFHILEQQKPSLFARKIKWIRAGIWITNIALLFFWTSLIGSGLVKISAALKNQSFSQMMKWCQPFFKIFATSGAFILLGIAIMILSAFAVLSGKTIPPDARKRISGRPYSAFAD
jgi:nitric oxide reductase subunit B